MMGYLAIAVLLVLGFTPGWGFLLDPPWVFITLPLYILWDEQFGE